MTGTSRRSFLRLVALGAAGTLAAACTTPAPPAAAPTAAPKAAAPTAAPKAAAPTAAPAAAPKAAAKDAAAEIAALYEAAKSEGGVEFYASLAVADAEKVLPKFEARYPGVKVNHTRAVGEDLFQRMQTEARAGRTIADVLSVNDQDMHPFLVSDYVAPYDPPEAAVYGADFKDPAHMWTVGVVAIDAIGYNTDLVKPEEAPQFYDDLVDPKWKGKILIDASSLTNFATHRNRRFGGDLQKTIEYFQKIAANEPELHEGGRAIAQLLAAGQNAVYLGAPALIINDLKAGGAPVDWSKKEAILEGALLSLASNAPHPNGAKLLINWFLSEDGQQAILDVGRLPARPGMKLPEGMMPDGVKWYVSTADTAQYYDENFKAWVEVLGIRASS